MNVRPSAVPQYEEYVKKILAGAKKIGAPQRVNGTQMILGGEGATYLFALNFDKWSEVDGWNRVPEILTKAYGESEAGKILQAGGAAMLGSETRVYRLLDDLVTTPSTAPSGAPSYYRVTLTEVHPDMRGEYEHQISRVKEIEEANTSSTTAIRRVSLLGPASVYVTARPFQNFAEMDNRPGGMLRKALGEEEARRFGEAISRCIKNRVSYVLAVRPDLSYQPGSQPTTN